ncbi:MAG: hypothetical protein CBD16_02110 [Betaproteobacteria bacterium TMED156]|nr:MAG: hypothetical protein CBD16_02110 [Betaproteobacteria bacterium TMED156]|tara:strand:- start:14940 stop:15566 length:627 start_codon:yes stop_codon:yes gene_type:complete
MIKHTGRVDSTNRRVVVVFPSIPEDQDNCLVVDINSLEQRYHDGLMQAVESPEAQASNKLFEVLGRKLFWDGKNILTTLHEKGFLRRVPVDTITLLPSPTETLPLKEFNAYQKMVEETKEEPAIPQTPDSSTKAGEMQQPADENDQDGIARNLLIQAEMMEADAHKKRAEAESVSPGIQKKLGKELVYAEPKRPRGRPKKEATAETTA